MSTEPFIGEVKIFGFNFAPRGYSLCEGQILSIAQNTALFSLLGTTYGGNGQTTFALPDLRGRAVIGQGQGPGLSDYSMGEVLGTQTTTLLTSNMPAHVHSGIGLNVQVPVSTGPGEDSSPVGNYLAVAPNDFYAAAPTGGQHLGQVQVGGTTAITGSGIPFNNMQPILTMNYSIAMVGIFPSRN